MRGVNQDELVVILRQLHMLLKDHQLIAAVLVQTNLADAQHAGLVQKTRNERDHLVRQLRVLGLLRIDA